jgi:hypothetical protein
MPLAAHAVWQDANEGEEKSQILHLRAAFGHETSPVLLHSEGVCSVHTVEQAEAFGAEIAKGLTASSSKS